MVIAERPLANSFSELPSICDKCGGYYLDEFFEKRIVCLNCGNQIYYGIPQWPDIGAYRMWDIVLSEPQRLKERTEPGALIHLGNGAAFYRDTGCKEAPSCLVCQRKKCMEEDIER